MVYYLASYSFFLVYSVLIFSAYTVAASGLSVSAVKLLDASAKFRQLAGFLNFFTTISFF